MARLIESSLRVDFTRSKFPLALKTLIQPWILDPLACLCEAIAFESDYLALARVSAVELVDLRKEDERKAILATFLRRRTAVSADRIAKRLRTLARCADRWESWIEIENSKNKTMNWGKCASAGTPKTSPA